MYYIIREYLGPQIIATRKTKEDAFKKCNEYNNESVLNCIGDAIVAIKENEKFKEVII